MSCHFSWLIDLLKRSLIFFDSSGTSHNCGKTFKNSSNIFDMLVQQTSHTSIINFNESQRMYTIYRSIVWEKRKYNTVHTIKVIRLPKANETCHKAKLLSFKTEMNAIVSFIRIENGPNQHTKTIFYPNILLLYALSWYIYSENICCRIKSPMQFH